jgi:hypothetical protein
MLYQTSVRVARIFAISVFRAMRGALCVCRRTSEPNGNDVNGPASRARLLSVKEATHDGEKYSVQQGP